MIEQTWLIILGLILVIFELLFGAIVGLDLVILGFSLIIGGVVFYSQENWQQAITVVIALFIIYLVYFRRIYKKQLLIFTQKLGIDTIEGKIGVVTKPISAKKAGTVLVEGELWTAKTKQNLKENEEIVVIEYHPKILEVSSLKAEIESQ